MDCPVCKTSSLNDEEIDTGLLAETCKTCRGKWISFSHYESWLKDRGGSRPALPAEGVDLTIPAFELARLCPKCRRILVKYRVGKDFQFKIDRCSNCAGVWLDSDEWETLKSRNLHDDLNKVFTDHWQADVARDETRRRLDKIYNAKFGEEDYRRIKEFKDWADKHEKNTEIISFIRDKNPLQF